MTKQLNRQAKLRQERIFKWQDKYPINCVNCGELGVYPVEKNFQNRVEACCKMGIIEPVLLYSSRAEPPDSWKEPKKLFGCLMFDNMGAGGSMK